MGLAVYVPRIVPYGGARVYMAVRPHPYWSNVVAYPPSTLQDTLLLSISGRVFRNPAL